MNKFIDCEYDKNEKIFSDVMIDIYQKLLSQNETIVCIKKITINYSPHVVCRLKEEIFILVTNKAKIIQLCKLFKKCNKMHMELFVINDNVLYTTDDKIVYLKNKNRLDGCIQRLGGYYLIKREINMINKLFINLEITVDNNDTCSSALMLTHIQPIIDCLNLFERIMNNNKTNSLFG